MDTLLNRFSEKVNSVITGFDRIVFKGMIMPIMYAAGMTSFLVARKVLNKDFKDYAIRQSQSIVQSAEELAGTLDGHGIEYIPSHSVRKEELAHARQRETGITEGLIGVWSCVESCNTFRSTYDANSNYPFLRGEKSKCKHLYYYFDDPVYGFMSVRLQTWAPYEIQVALNGREWLRRSLDASGCGYAVEGNKFLHIDDYDLAQRLLDEQFKIDFNKVLKGLLPTVFPRMPEVVGKGLSYHWTYWQTEVAKDYIFKDSRELSALMDDFQIYALITGKGDRILKYFGSPVSADGQPHHFAKPEIISRTNSWYDGARVRHWNGSNSVKFYNEHNVLRFEMTMNDPTRFRIHRHAENQDKSEPKSLLPMRKGIADTAARAAISKQIIDRFTEHMATVKEKTRLRELLDSVGAPMVRKGKRVRALNVFGKDLELICAISDPSFDVNAITNKQLQKALKDTPWANKMSGKNLSARITRHLRLLREHGLIKKLPKQRKYLLTDKGRKIAVALNAALATSVEGLLELAA
jgi:hypothetical protein